MCTRRLGVLGVVILTGWIWFLPEMQAQFTPGRLAVLRVGDGSTSVNSAAAYSGAIFEVTDNSSSGLLSNSAITNLTPIPGSSNGDSLTFSGSGVLEGHINRSSDGLTLIVPGYAAAVGTTNVASSSDPRGVARISGDGSVTFQRFSSYSGEPVHAAASENGNQVWITSQSGTDAGTRYFANSDILPTAGVQITDDSHRFIENVDGTLVVSTQKTISYYSGTPTSAASTSDLITKLNDVNGFVFLDRQSGVGDSTFGGSVDTLYLAEKTDQANTSTITKFSFDGTGWVERGSFNPGGTATGPGTVGGIFALTGFVDESGNAILYGTDNEGDSARVFNNNQMFRVSDTAASDATMNGTLDWTIHAGDGYAFRGVDFVPVPEPTSVMAIGCSLLGLGAYIRRRWVHRGESVQPALAGSLVAR